jgi:hypothetical protein
MPQKMSERTKRSQWSTCPDVIRSSLTSTIVTSSQREAEAGLSTNNNYPEKDLLDDEKPLGFSRSQQGTTRTFPERRGRERTSRGGQEAITG